MASLTRVSFGPNDSFVLVHQNDVNWSGRLPSDVWNKLNGRYNNKGQNNAPISNFDIGGDGDGGTTYAMFMTDGNWCVSHSTLSNALNENGINGGDITFISLGANNSYIMKTDSSVYWNNIPCRAEELIQSRTQHSSVSWAALGADDAWFLKFADGMYYCGGGISSVCRPFVLLLSSASSLRASKLQRYWRAGT
eukprot:408586_1